MRYLFASVVALFSLALIISAGQAQGDKKEEKKVEDKKTEEKKTEEKKADEKPKFTIKEVMQKAQNTKGPQLAKKVYAGGASKEEKDQLVELYTALSINTPPKGDLKDWKDRTTAMVDAAKAVAKMDDDKSRATLQKVASACMDCHPLHKGK